MTDTYKHITIRLQCYQFISDSYWLQCRSFYACSQLVDFCLCLYYSSIKWALGIINIVDFSCKHWLHRLIIFCLSWQSSISYMIEYLTLGFTLELTLELQYVAYIMFSCFVLINVSNFISYNSSYCREWKRNTECEILGFKLQ